VPPPRLIARELASLAIALAALGPPALADHALIIGIGHYADPHVPTLPGIDKDVSSAQQLAHVFGFNDADTTVLRDAEATLERVQAQIHRVLGGAAGDRALIYFSGHGTHVLDEEGKPDGALVMSDLRPTGGGHATGALMGHWIGNELKLARVAYALLLVDACNSGEITKDFKLEPTYGFAVNKYFATPGFPGGEQPKLWKGDGASGWIAMSAVQDDQYAPASSVGSPFTNAVGIALANARRANASLTPVQLREAVIAELDKLGIPTDLGPKGANPHVWGDPSLLAKSLPVAAAPGRIWAQLQATVQQSTPGAVSIHMASTRIHHGQPLEFALDLERGGYVTVINANEKDDAEVLIPNAAVPELRLAAGHYLLPQEIKRTWVAEEPERVLVAVIVTPKKLDLNRAPGKGPPGTSPADLLVRELRTALEQNEAMSAVPGPAGAAEAAGATRARLFHDRTTDAAQPSATVTRPEAVSIESEIVP